MKYLKYLLIIGLISFITFTYIICIGYAPSESMAPTIETGDIVIINRLAYSKCNEPARKDIISFYSHEFDQIVGKRVIGIEGDKIEFKDGYVYVNGARQIENYTQGCTYKNDADTYIVPNGCVFVLGDNREISLDSRYFKNPFIKVEDIQGKVIYIF